MTVTVRLTVNDRSVERGVPPRRSLTDFLREDLGLTGTHVGCEHGVCGACTVLLDGRTARACLLFAAQLEGARVTTIEGLTPGDGLSPIREALAGNLCMCTGYVNIVRAVEQAAAARSRQQEANQ